ncbi:mutS protein homolog 5-like isoform X2 [Patella vulgata]|uniref:mutS protein homolog 5-like isoform X2 n=1 Tax=Patella vulgata TaxID=6465 RepID=UPI0024A8BC9E|nr:mutS protein homolog 5-like isoform X2 [Patella vulgata]
MHRLQNTILEHSQVIYDVMEYTAELDCLMALSTCAREFRYVRPQMVKEDIIDVQSGRHPVQEICCSQFVPNDYCSKNGEGKIKILTGPNACGKSVYLKQVALIVYMSHIGSFVPAESATIGTVDRIFTRIKSLESVSIGLSTFMLDISQMSEALNCATNRSLVMVDEFGKGTESIDGLSLLCSSLRYWQAMENLCPHILVSTHFHSIIHRQILPQTPQLKFLVSDLLRKKQPVHRVDSESTENNFKRCQAIVSNFLELDLDNDDVEKFLKEYVLTTYKD